MLTLSSVPDSETVLISLLLIQPEDHPCVH